MKPLSLRKQLIITSMIAGITPCIAGTDVWFTPLTGSAPVVPANSLAKGQGDALRRFGGSGASAEAPRPGGRLTTSGSLSVFD